MDEEELPDICLNCGNLVESALLGGECDCKTPNVVHQQPCDGCKRLIGQITDDDYCGPEKLYCPDCVDKARRAE